MLKSPRVSGLRRAAATNRKEGESSPMLPVLYFVVPCYKDEDVLPVTGPVFLEKLTALIGAGLIAEESRVLFVNDGSPDRTWEAILALHEQSDRLIGVDLQKNCGEKNALLAGMYFAAEKGKADCVITMDSDLQDDIAVTDEMLRKFTAGADLVLGVRSDRTEDSLRERFFSKGFYIAMDLLKTGQVPQHSNFRLMSRRAVEALKARENIPYFLPTMASVLPFPKETVLYHRSRRAAGSSGYNFSKKFFLALDAMLVHSDRLPLFFGGAAVVFGAVSASAAAGLPLRRSAFRTAAVVTAAAGGGSSLLIALTLQKRRKRLFRDHVPAGMQIKRTTSEAAPERPSAP